MNDIEGAKASIRFNSDEDGDLYLHTDDPASAHWTVELVGRRLGDDSHRETAARSENSIGFPALNWHVAFSAWWVGREHCHLELTDERGVRRILDTCPHNLPTETTD